MKILVYADVQVMPGGNRFSWSTQEMSPEEIARLSKSELKDFLTALTEISTPTVAHILIKEGKRVPLHEHCARLVVTSPLESAGRYITIFGIGYNDDPEGGDYVEAHGLDPVPEKIASEHREKIMQGKKDLAGWRAYFRDRFRQIHESNTLDAKHLLHIASFCVEQSGD